MWPCLEASLADTRRAPPGAGSRELIRLWELLKEYRELLRREPFLGTRWLKRGMQVVRAIFYARPAYVAALWPALITFRSRPRFEHRLGKWSKPRHVRCAFKCRPDEVGRERRPDESQSDPRPGCT